MVPDALVHRERLSGNVSRSADTLQGQRDSESPCRSVKNNHAIQCNPQQSAASNLAYRGNPRRVGEVPSDVY